MNKNLEKIVWLASYPKSGNTWFRIFLSNLFSQSQEPVDINEILNSNIASNRNLFDKLTGVNSSDLSDDEIEILRPEVYRELASGLSEPLYMKVHDAWSLNSRGEPLFPSEVTSGVVYFIRNPLDVAVSFANHDSILTIDSLNSLNRSDFSLCGNPEKLSNQFKQKLLSWSEHVTSWIDHSCLPVHVIRYEDMLSTPEETFTRACEFLNLNFNSAEVRAAVKSSSLEVLQEQEAQFGFKEKPSGVGSFFQDGRTGSWGEHFDISQVEQFMEKNRSVMQRFGYYQNHME